MTTPRTIAVLLYDATNAGVLTKQDSDILTGATPATEAQRLKVERALRAHVEAGWAHQDSCESAHP